MAKIIVNEQLCKGCSLCIPSCPQNIIVVSERFNANGYKCVEQINEEKCTACKLCAIMCPESAIEVYK